MTNQHDLQWLTQKYFYYILYVFVGNFWGKIVNNTNKIMTNIPEIYFHTDPAMWPIKSIRFEKIAQKCVYNISFLYTGFLWLYEL